MNKIYLLLILLLFASTNLSAQETALPKQINGGVLNGKALSLPKPEYPSAARAVKAEGNVNVQITIDEQGNVILASAVSGHPLLRQTCEKAAREAKFLPTTLNGQSVKVSGIIVYKFVTDVVIKSFATNWYQTGVSLSALDGIPTLKHFETNSLNFVIPADWTNEREKIKRLDELKKAEMEMNVDNAPKERVLDEVSSNSDNNKNAIKTTTTRITISPDKKTFSEVTAISQDLISSIRGRLGADEISLWYFELGVNFNKALLNSDSRVEKIRIEGVKPFRELIKNPPSEISEDIISNLEKMASFMEKGMFTDEDIIAMSQLITKLNNLLLQN